MPSTIRDCLVLSPGGPPPANESATPRVDTLTLHLGEPVPSSHLLLQARWTSINRQPCLAVAEPAPGLVTAGHTDDSPNSTLHLHRAACLTQPLPSPSPSSCCCCSPCVSQPPGIRTTVPPPCQQPLLTKASLVNLGITAHRPLLLPSGKRAI